MAKPLIDWPQTDRPLGLEEFKALYDEFREMFGFEDPYPPFEKLLKESVQKLDAALAAVNFIDSNGNSRYRPGPEKVSAYLYFVNKSHFLFNGNKRASLVAAFAYLRINGKWINTNWEDIYEIAKNIASQAGSKDREKVIKINAKFIQKKLSDFDSKKTLLLSNTVEEWFATFLVEK